MALVTLGISALHSLFGAVCYTQGWAGSWIAVFVSFFSTALTTAFCFCVIYRESMKTCWILASAFSLLGDFSSNLAALCMISNGPYNLAVWKERVVYLIMMHVITPLIEVIFVLLLQKLGILRVFWDWLTQKEFRLVSVLAFSLYPVWEYGIFTCQSVAVGRSVQRLHSGQRLLCGVVCDRKTKRAAEEADCGVARHDAAAECVY